MLAGLLLAVFVVGSLFVQSPWEGVDVAVVGTKAEELGGRVSDPLINLSGDFLLFVFTAAGAIGGFVAGYVWRDLFGRDTARPGGASNLPKES
jgi:hypothetical protein